MTDIFIDTALAVRNGSGNRPDGREAQSVSKEHYRGCRVRQPLPKGHQAREVGKYFRMLDFDPATRRTDGFCFTWMR